MTPAEMREMAVDGISAMIAEFEKMTRYGSPIAKAANENLQRARECLSSLKAIPIPDTTAADEAAIVEAMLVAANDACNDDDEDHAGAMRAALAAARPLIAAAADDVLEKAHEALRRICLFLDPLADSVFNDNGDVTVTNPPSFGYEGYCSAYFLRRTANLALAAIDAAKAKGGG